MSSYLLAMTFISVGYFSLVLSCEWLWYKLSDGK